MDATKGVRSRKHYYSKESKHDEDLNTLIEQSAGMTALIKHWKILGMLATDSTNLFTSEAINP